MIISGAIQITLLNGETKTIPCNRYGDVYHMLEIFDIERDKSKDKLGFIAVLPDTEDESNFIETFMCGEAAMEHALSCGQIDCSLTYNDLYMADLW